MISLNPIASVTFKQHFTGVADYPDYLNRLIAKQVFFFKLAAHIELLRSYREAENSETTENILSYTS
jgi:hypothetical protein